ncbi:hypothetical protein [Clostridium saccharoperbutylacetonicum]|uniref:hypothetical protein n=1 Tax=Clostridium saccharoperbutylacetonicum TaxID=36745 RepID=UPI0039ECBEF0
MGNLIKDFWTRTYKEKNYFGIIEVVRGTDFAQIRNRKRYEIHIDQALEYTYKNNVLSHMSLQTFCKKCEYREDKDEMYYPFTVEFEPMKNGQDQGKYEDAVLESYKYVHYLKNSLNIKAEDILIMINNSKSIYVFVNPKAYLCKPEARLNDIYYEMYLKIKKELNLSQVDESVVSSNYKLIKTPNTLYNGGYFVRISEDELMKLVAGSVSKEELTRSKRSLKNIEVPGELSLAANRLFSNARKKVLFNKNIEVDQGVKEFNSCCKGTCVQYFLQHLIEEGYRNHALVSVGIYLKSIGYSKEETINNLIELAEGWNHDESERKIISKVNSIYRHNYRFSCNKAKMAFSGLEIDNMCSNCPYAKNSFQNTNTFEVDADIINQLWDKKGSTRHYLMYLNLSSKDLFNKNIELKSENINERTLKELCKLAPLTLHKVEGVNGVVCIENNTKGNKYRLKKEFIEESAVELGESLKHYLKLLIKGYKATDKYIMIRSSIETIMEVLNYENKSSAYKLLNKLNTLGLIKAHKKSVYTLYYRSYKVVELYSSKSIELQENTAIAAGGEQITFNCSNRNTEAKGKRIYKPGNGVKELIVNGIKIRVHEDLELDVRALRFIKENLEIIKKYKRLYIHPEEERYYFKYKPINLEDWIQELLELKLMDIKLIKFNAEKYGYSDKLEYIFMRIFGSSQAKVFLKKHKFSKKNV